MRGKQVAKGRPHVIANIHPPASNIGIISFVDLSEKAIVRCIFLNNASLISLFSQSIINHPLLLLVYFLQVLNRHFRSHCMKHQIISFHCIHWSLLINRLTGLLCKIMPISIDISNPVNHIF